MRTISGMRRRSPVSNRWYPQLCLVVGGVLSTQGGEGLYGLRTVKPVQA